MKTNDLRYGLRTIPLLVSALMAGACGGDASQESAASTQARSDGDGAVKACQVFSAADAESVLGVPFTLAKSSAYGSVEECTFETLASAARPIALTIRVEGTGNADATYQRMRELFSEEELKIGQHRALISASSQIIVVTADKQVLISLGMPMVPRDQRRERLVKVAEAVVARL